MTPAAEAGAGGGCAATARGLTHIYPGGRAALSGVDLDLPFGRVTAILGANGSGKTTLLRLLAGALRPTAGGLSVLGADCARAPLPGRLRARLGYAAQETALDPDMTGPEMLWLLAALHAIPRRRRAARVDAVAGALGLRPPPPGTVATWSGGQRRRLHLALSLLHEPDLLLLDEPTAGLDPDGSAALWEHLRLRAARGAAVAVVTHDLASVEGGCSDVVILEGGRVAGVVPPRDVARAYARLTGRDAAALRASPPRGGGRRRRA